MEKPIVFIATKLHTHSLKCLYCSEIAKYLIHPFGNLANPFVECQECLLKEE